MELTLFSILGILSITLIILGFWKKEGAYSFLGFFFIAILGATILIPQNLEIPQGFNETSITTGNTTTTTTTTIYSPYDNTRLWGIYITFLGAIGCAITTTEIKKAFG